MRRTAASPLVAPLPAENVGRVPGAFRPDIEGLRGLAVVPVLLYHAAVPWFEGGYVGVDVFFVLSGYLITGLLLREVAATGRLSLPRFYARRARRILPAAALVLLAILLASALVLPPLRAADVAVDGTWAALFAANIRFALKAADYLSSDIDASPLLHYWSLGVEEQFYLLWPLLLLVAVRRRSNAARAAAVLATVVVLASFALSLRLTHTNIPWAFYSLPTRAWELGLGALLVLAELHGRRLPAWAAAAAGWSGVALIVAAVTSFDDRTPYPGTAALLPTIGAVALIAAGARASRAAPGRLLSTAIPRFFGRISYSLYLWSWPLLVIPAAAAEGALSLRARLALAALAVPIAAISQRLVEQPLRRGQFIGTVAARNLVYAAAVSLAVVAVAVGTYGRARWQLGPGGSAGEPVEALVPLAGGPLPADVVPPLATVRDDEPAPYREGCHVRLMGTRSGECAYGVPSATHTVVLFGDSHAAHWFPALERIATARGWRLLHRTKSACSVADVAQWDGRVRREYHECADWRESVVRELEAQPPALVVISGAGRVGVMANGRVIAAADRPAAWAAGLTRTIRRLEATGAAVVVIADTPRPNGDAPVCLSGHVDDVRACANPRARAVDEQWRALEWKTAQQAGATFVDPTDWVCPIDPCPAVISSRLVYRDHHHLSTPFSALLASRLAEQLPR